MASKDYIVMLPFMVQGHLIPFLGLATKLNRTHNLRITIATTPLNITYLTSTLTSSSSSSSSTQIRFLELPFCSADHGLPPNTENSDNLSSQEEIGKLVIASASLKTPFLELLSHDICGRENNRRPLCIISDAFFGWPNDVANVVGTVNLTFSTAGAYGTLAFISICQNLPHRKTDSDEFNVPGFPKRCRFSVSQLDQLFMETDGTDPGYKFMDSLVSSSLKSFGWLINTVEEIEPLGLDCLRKYGKLPIWPVGPLLPPEMLSDRKGPNPSFRRTVKNPGISTEDCIAWLDSQPVNSVVYVSFGSQNNISPTQMMELATGLEKSGKPFIWVVRPPAGFDRKSEFRSEWLPEGYEERIGSTKQGLLVRNWGPQLEILSHESTGAFLSHCGWNSVVESLSQGVPVIGWPLAAEQGYNAKMLAEEMGVCEEVGRGLEREVTWQEVKEAVELATDSVGKGGEMRERALEIGKLMRDSVTEKGSSSMALEDVVSTLMSK